MLKSKLRKLDIENRALKRRLTKSSIDTEDLSVEIAEIKTEENVARLWKSDPSNPANNASAAANPAGSTPAAAQPTSQVSNVSNAANPANTTSNAAANTAPAAVATAKTSVDENLAKEKTKSDVDEFEIQEDEILQYKNALETDQMKKDLEKKLEIANNKVNLNFNYIISALITVLKLYYFQA